MGPVAGLGGCVRPEWDEQFTKHPHLVVCVVVLLLPGLLGLCFVVVVVV